MKTLGVFFRPTVALALLIGLGGIRASANATGEDTNTFRYDDYALILKSYVNDHGMVNYRGLQANRERLEVFISAMGRLNPKRYSQWSERRQIAFWINAYNALVLKIIIDHYPIRPSLFKLAVFPRHSIWHISGVWGKLKFPVMGRPMSLNDIEHETLRKNFNEPRIHVAIVCASIGCPPLRNEPFRGERLDTQLEDQSRRFLSNQGNFRIDKDNKKVHLSSIFKWFGEDFVDTYGREEKSQGRRQTVRAVLNFTSKHVSPEEGKYLATEVYSIQYTDYDWSLNEQKEELE
jgi:hypothetical protein